ncbi:MAG: hypothetical protein K8T25_14505 [Planctomycetia bacterium]|nr:hypothetical protein [Planctomycetia bacterium]
MSDDFNAYEKWLGIPQAEQPPNHYRLLGIPLLAADADMIANAADQRMIYLRTFGTSQQRDLAERLLGEVSTARACLLNDAKKAAYDAELASGSARSSAPVVPIGPRLPDANVTKRPPPRKPEKATTQPIGQALPNAASDDGESADHGGPMSLSVDFSQPARRNPGKLSTAKKSQSRKATSGLGSGGIIALIVGGICAAVIAAFVLLGGGDSRPAPPVVTPTPDPVPPVAQVAARTPKPAADPVPEKFPAAPLIENDVRPPVTPPPFPPQPAPKTPSPEDRATSLANDLQRVLSTDDLSRAMTLARQLAETEQKDVLDRQIEILATYTKKATSPVALKSVVVETAPLVHAAMEAKRPKVARQGAALALVAARRLDDPDAIRDATLLVLEARKSKTE